ncbi:hypothetical protein LMH87_001391 [Akanthomyces muscarius]|uniref:NACHT domain-containing protein n=1 Tax=Akanthomyces muscarius TaxID=2231603 RepID=A0A9W8Q513_AKAMU|nr:hypothetical protein LMH87_001391 [Akanthomyces muscarius]KAJ4146832.1 hypothetical protein LMH87_001391 [Akanthomyces muscarius]
MLLENTTRAVDIVKSISNDIKGIQFATAKMQEGVQNLYTTVLNANQTTVLDRLRIAKGASFDSYAQEHTSFCLPNTRVELLQQIIDWAKDASGEPVFWLNGMAGTGKSTISRTVARLLADEGRLGASFFFKNGEADRGTLSKFFTTIAADLAVRKPYVASRIKDILDADPSITTKNAGEQFDKLLLQPLLKTATEETPIAFIIDALDECERDDDVRLLLRLFTRFKTELPRQMRIFLTSRPELPIRCAFQKIQGTYQGAILHEVPQPMVARDISLFLKHELARIREDYNDSRRWPSLGEFQRALGFSENYSHDFRAKIAPTSHICSKTPFDSYRHTCQHSI